jgi:hypothetical protein
LKLLKSLNPNLLGEAPLFSGDVILVPKKVTFDQDEKEESQKIVIEELKTSLID